MLAVSIEQKVTKKVTVYKSKNNLVKNIIIILIVKLKNTFLKLFM